MKVLVLSPHTDDAELGCGGYLTKLHEEGAEIVVAVFSDCSNIWTLPLMEECEISLKHINAGVIIGDYPLRGFHGAREVILSSIVEIKTGTPWDLVLCPSSTDIHQDHQVVHQEAVRAFRRDTNLLAYELPWNTRGFNPTYFVELQEKHIQGKLRMLSEYRSQIELNRLYFEHERVRGQARGRGLQIKKEYAEAFEVINWIT